MILEIVSYNAENLELIHQVAANVAEVLNVSLHVMTEKESKEIEA